MCYFPLIPLPSCSSNGDPSTECCTWKADRHSTTGLLLISALAGVALIAIGISGLVVSNFPLRSEYCIAGICLGSAFILPLAIAMILNFKPEEERIDLKDPLALEKKIFRDSVPAGYYSKIRLSDGYDYYVGRKKVGFSIFTATTLYQIHCLPGLEPNPQDNFPGLTFFNSSK